MMGISKFAVRLRELRNERGLSCMKLAEGIGVSDTSVIRWENGQADIKGEYLILVAKFFNVTTDYLLGVKDF